jgi:hypothetical protein
MAKRASKPALGDRSARRGKTSQRDETPIYFGGFSGVPGIQRQQPLSLGREYIPLDKMDAHARRQAFGLWLGIVYLNGTDDYEYRHDVPAEEDPLLVLQFTKEYEAGAWRKLGRGLTLQELALTLEYSTGQGFMALVNSNGPPTHTPRLTRKLVLDADAILELVMVSYGLKGAGRRRPLATLFYDGKIGHCITLLDADPSGARFAYHDPWPGRSLLCAEHSAAGIAATSLGTTKIHFSPDKSVETPVWGVTREELARVLVSTFIMLPDWSGLMLGMVSGALSPRVRQQLKAALAAQADAAEKVKRNE